MKKILILLMVISVCVIPANAAENDIPDVPESGELYMPDETESFGEALWFVIQSAVRDFWPEIYASAGSCLAIFCTMMLVSFVGNFPGASGKVLSLVSTLLIGMILLDPSNFLIQLGVNTVTEMTEYGKLLLPVLTGALAAQGGVTSSAALHTLTMFFSSLLSTMIIKLVVPMIYIYLCLSIVGSFSADDLIQNMKKFMKWLITWSLKIILYVFTGFMGITGVVSGTADASTVKAVKLSITGMVPVVGGIISDASESIIVGASVLKNSAGIYGIVAIIAVFIGPFLKIGVQYIMLKITASVCSVFSNKQQTELLKDFSGGMGMVLAMTGTVCLLLLISIVCFMKGLS